MDGQLARCSYDGGGVWVSVAEVHAMINFDNTCDAIFVAEELSSFFDTVDWQALFVTLQHLRALAHAGRRHIALLVLARVGHGRKVRQLCGR